MATNNSINAKTAGLVTYDGSGTWSAQSITQHAVPVGGANSQSLTSLSVGSNGQVLVGSTGADPVFATLTGTGGITFTTGAGTLAINNTGGGLSWSVISADQTAATNHGYFANKGSLLTLTLPTTTVVGDVIALVNINGAAFAKILSANPGTINIGTSVCTANTGSLTSTGLGDAIFLVAQTTASVWYAYGVQGNWTVA
jgi:hypothetical protein